LIVFGKSLTVNTVKLTHIYGNVWAAGGIAEVLFRSAGLEPPRPIGRCVSYGAATSLMLYNEMLSLTHQFSLGRFPTHDALQEISVTETMPSLTVGLYTRVGTPLTRVAAAMAQHVSAVAREVGGLDLKLPDTHTS
jgi:hypothetical protein